MPLNPTDIIFGRSTNITWAVKNNSTNILNSSWIDKIYLSDNPTFDSSDRLLDQVTDNVFGNLAPDSSYNQNYNLNITDPSLIDKQQYLIVIANSDGQISETNSSNNITIVPIFFL